MAKRSIAMGDPDAFNPEKMKRLVEQTDRQTSRLAQLVVSQPTDIERQHYANDKDAWEAARTTAKKNSKNNRGAIRKLLDEIGPEPKPLEHPMLIDPGLHPDMGRNGPELRGIELPADGEKHPGLRQTGDCREHGPVDVAFRDNFAKVIAANPSIDSIDEFLGGFDSLMTLPTVLH